jgi:hypothetical protein
MCDIFAMSPDLVEQRLQFRHHGLELGEIAGKCILGSDGLADPVGSDITVIDASRNPVVVLVGVSEVGLQKFERLVSDMEPGEQPLADVQVTDGFRCSPSAFSLNTQKSMLSPKVRSTPSIPARDLTG